MKTIIPGYDNETLLGFNEETDRYEFIDHASLVIGAFSKEELLSLLYVASEDSSCILYKGTEACPGYRNDECRAEIYIDGDSSYVQSSVGTMELPDDILDTLLDELDVTTADVSKVYHFEKLLDVPEAMLKTCQSVEAFQGILERFCQ